MPESSEHKTPVTEIKLEVDAASGGGLDAWSRALRDLERPAPRPAPRTPAPAAPAPAAPAAAAPAPPPPPPAGPVDAAANTADACVAAILCQIDAAHAAITEFQKTHPYLIAPNVCSLWTDSLREVAVTMRRQHEIAQQRAEQRRGAPQP
jgi:hypothetical protein